MSFTILSPGTFESPSGKIIITDPCYYRDPADVHSAAIAKPGRWVVHVMKLNAGPWDGRCSALWIHHEDHPVDILDPAWEETAMGTAVDSGQAGFFDSAHFNDESAVTETIADPLTGENVWYDLCCDRTLKEPFAGIIPFGCVSSSGFGDGGYPAHAVYENGVAVALGLNFYLQKAIFIPQLSADETRLYDTIRHDRLEDFRALVNQEPQLPENRLFRDFALYHGKDAFLLEIAGRSAGTGFTTDFYHLVQSGNVELMRKLLPYVSEIEDPYDVLSWLPILADEDLALELSAELVKAGIDPNAQPESEWEEPLVFLLADMEKPRLLEFWVNNGLDIHTRNRKRKTVMEMENMDEVSRTILSHHFDPAKVK
jgi:hypothetical protein